MLSRIRRKNSISSQSTFCTQSAVCCLHFVRSLVFVPCLQSAFCTDRIGIAVFVRASLKSVPKYWPELEKKFGEVTLAAMIYVWTVCRRAPEEEHSDGVMITLYQL